MGTPTDGVGKGAMEFVLVVEDHPDAKIARELADRVVLAHSGTWLDPHTLDAMRTWCGLEAQKDYWRVNRHSWCGSDLKTPGMSSRPDRGRERDLPDIGCCPG
jgi:hypothetical protein